MLGPRDEDAERSILGALLAEDADEHRADALVVLETEAFVRDEHRHILTAIVSLHERDEPVDSVTVMCEIRRVGAEVSPAYLAQLDDSAFSANVGHYIGIVKKCWIQRQALGVLMNASSTLEARQLDLTDCLHEITSNLAVLTHETLDSGPGDLKSVLREECKHYDLRSSGEVTPLATGYKSLDDLLGGFWPGDLVLLAARPSQGKTALCLSIMLNAAKDGKRTLFFSLEMNKRAVAQRMIALSEDVNLHHMRRGKLQETGMKLYTKAIGDLEDMSIWINDKSLSIGEIQAIALRYKARYEIDMVVVDYLQLIHPRKGMHSREREVADISQSLKGMAKTLDIPVLALSQLSRGALGRQDKRPTLGDLRDSGSLEQDADAVLFIHREAQLDPGNTNLDPGAAEIIVGKQRNGPCGSVGVRWSPRNAKFVEMR